MQLIPTVPTVPQREGEVLIVPVQEGVSLRLTLHEALLFNRRVGEAVLDLLASSQRAPLPACATIHQFPVRSAAIGGG